MFYTAGISSKWTFCSTDFVLLAGFVLYVRRVDKCRNMAADGVALAEVRAGITFGVELYVPWDAPEPDTSLEGVVPLRNVPDVIGLVGKSCASGPRHSQCASPGSGLSWRRPEFS